MPILAEIYFHLYEGSEAGQKPPVVLIHGAGGSHLYWPSDVRRLPGYRVYAIDLPGHGKSEGRGHQSIPAYVQSVLGWLEQSGLHRAVFVGHSMGSAIAMSLALDHPEHVLGLGLVGAGARLRVAEALLESASSATTFHNAVDMVISWSFSPQTSERLVRLASERMAETRYSVLHGDFLACNGFDLSERVGEIRCPTLVVCGEQDKMTPKRHSQFLADCIPEARLEVIPDAGHMVMLEQPKAVVGVLMDFLGGIHY
jgi:pimeloyl-ACP methyl ester carboxylesterase